MQAPSPSKIDFSTPAVMAILNFTPDSFYAGSRVSDTAFAISKCGDFFNAGAKYIDLGAYSTRPGAAAISVQEELDRLIPMIETLVKEYPEGLFSVDTFRAEVAEQAILAGAHIINDISAGELDPDLPLVVAKYQIPYIFMHMKGNPQTMQSLCDYEDMRVELKQYFVDKINYFRSLGIQDLILDPGFGFAKTLDQNYELLQNLNDFNAFGLPVLVGFSRKSMITKLLDIKSEAALNATTVLNTFALLNGASILRVHDPVEAHQAIQLVQKIANPYQVLV